MVIFNTHTKSRTPFYMHRINFKNTHTHTPQNRWLDESRESCWQKQFIFFPSVLGQWRGGKKVHPVFSDLRDKCKMAKNFFKTPFKFASLQVFHWIRTGSMTAWITFSKANHGTTQTPAMPMLGHLHPKETHVCVLICMCMLSEVHNYRTDHGAVRSRMEKYTVVCSCAGILCMLKKEWTRVINVNTEVSHKHIMKGK